MADESKAISARREVPGSLQHGGESYTVDVPDTDNHDSYKMIDAGNITFTNAEQTTLRLSVADADTWRPANVRHVKLLPTSRESSHVIADLAATLHAQVQPCPQTQRDAMGRPI